MLNTDELKLIQKKFNDIELTEEEKKVLSHIDIIVEMNQLALDSQKILVELRTKEQELLGVK